MSSTGPGHRVGKFLLIEQIGAGGFGAVYKAKQEDLGRTVALKFLHSENAEDVRRFVREAQTAAQLTHPNIVPIYEVGEHDGRPFIAMELIDGRTPEKMNLDPRRAAEVMRDVAGAIHYAHQKGIIHRDLKPQNILIGADGRAWVMDFGLARSVKPGSTMTLSGMMVGTPAYMPPEQAEGKRSDERSDVYGLGATLYELVAGRPPFTGQSALDVAMAVVQTEPDHPTRLRPSVPAELETIILKAMEKDPARRYATARDFGEDLRRHLDGEPILATPASMATRAAKWAKRNRATTASALVFAVAVLTAALVYSVGAWRAARELAGIAEDAAAAERNGDWTSAATLWARAEAKGHRAARGRTERASRRAQEEDEKRRAAAMVKEAADREADYERVRRRVAEILPELRTERAILKDHDPAEKKERYWTLERELIEARKRLVVLESQIVGPYLSALQLAPHDKQLAERLIQFEWDRLEEAIAEGDEVRAAQFEEDLRQLARRLGRTDLVTKLDGGARIAISTDPAAAEAWLFRYEPGHGVIVPRPFSGSERRSTVSEKADALACTDFNRIGTTPVETPPIPRGSYLVVVRMRGRAEARVPVVVGVSGARMERVKLYEDAPSGFLFVPGGRCITGGDILAVQPVPRDTPTVGDFFMMRTEVTIGAYVEFLQALVEEGRQKEAQARSPREDGGFYMIIPADATRVDLPAGIDPNRPVYGVSWNDATAYADWLTRTRGRGSWMFRLPTSVEWEKAARGADGRSFPWGDTFDWTFTKGGRSRASGRLAESVLAYPRDESPYGIRDLAGNVKEWCLDWFDEGKGWRHIRGGSWALSTDAPFRAASRWGDIGAGVGDQTGFRVIAVPRK